MAHARVTAWNARSRRSSRGEGVTTSTNTSGGTRTGPNFDAEHVAKVGARLAAKGLRESVMVDCSHGNSLKDHARQAGVADALCEQIAGGSRRIFGAMLESHLVEGRQDYVPGRAAVHGQSITDACISLAQTEPLLEQLAAAQQARGVPGMRADRLLDDVLDDVR